MNWTVPWSLDVRLTVIQLRPRKVISTCQMNTEGEALMAMDLLGRTGYDFIVLTPHHVTFHLHGASRFCDSYWDKRHANPRHKLGEE